MAQYSQRFVSRSSRPALVFRSSPLLTFRTVDSLFFNVSRMTEGILDSLIRISCFAASEIGGAEGGRICDEKATSTSKARGKKRSRG